MRQELQTSIGIYAPSFLNMQLNVAEDCSDIFNLTPTASAAFLHEYVHFLQDLTTIYGLANCVSVVQYIKTVNAHQREGADRAFRLPYILNKQRDMGVYYNFELKRLRTGSVQNIEETVVQRMELETRSVAVGPTTMDVERVKVTILNQLNEEKVIYFGAHAVLEGMAFGVEQMIYPYVLERAPDFPYASAFQVIQFVYPQVGNNPLNLVALCDAALMFDNPGAIFYKSLIKMGQEDYVPPSPEAIYNFVYDSFPVQFHTLDTIPAIFHNQTLTALGEINSYFTTPLYAANRLWIDYTFRAANEIRSHQPYFFLELASGGTLNANVVFRNLFTRLGMPLVTDREGRAFFASPVDHTGVLRPDILWTVNQLFNIYINSSRSQLKRCGLETWCRNTCEEKGVEDFTDQRCWDSPWQRVSDENGLCVFAQLWRTWGLENEIPVFTH